MSEGGRGASFYSLTMWKAHAHPFFANIVTFEAAEQ
jgi:hypothetical protein